jgi:hypothetical protein
MSKVVFFVHNGSFREERKFPGITAREAKNLLRGVHGLTPKQARGVLNATGPAWGAWVSPGAEKLPFLAG